MIFQYQLAEALGKTRAELLSNMSGTELSHWRAFYKIYPMPQVRADIHAGMVRQSIFAGTQKKLFTLDQCTPDFNAKKKEMHWKTIKGIIGAICKTLPVIKMKRPEKKK